MDMRHGNITKGSVGIPAGPFVLPPLIKVDLMSVKFLIISILYLLFLFSGSPAFAQPCLADFPSSSYYRAMATAATEEEARSQAVSQLVAQFPSTYSARKQERQTDTGGQVSGTFSLTMEVTSRLRLMGVQYFKCPGKRREKDYSVVAYISRQDLERSAAQTGAKVQEYVGMMGTKGTDAYIREGMVAYLYAHLSPRPVQVKAGGVDRPDAEAWLESVLREHLSSLRISCIGVEEQNGYTGQLVFNMDVQGGVNGLDLLVEAPAFNARDRITSSGGAVHVIMEPALRREKIRMVASLMPQVLPDELREVVSGARISRELTLDIDFSPVIRVGILREERGRDWLLKPDISGLSIRQWEWLVDGKVRSFQSELLLSRSENAGSVRLRVNNSDELTADLVLKARSASSSTPSNRDVGQTGESSNQRTASSAVTPRPDAGNSSPRIAVSQIPGPILKIAAAPEARMLESVLQDLQRTGKIMTGRKYDFQDPERCWIAVVGKEAGKLLYMLSPGKLRTDVATSRTFADFEQDLASELNGAAVLWIEVYDQD